MSTGDRQRGGRVIRQRIADAAEIDRLAFMEMKHGKNEALAFAERAMRQYRKAVTRSRKRGYKNPHYASLPEYRRRFIESYCAFKRYLREADINQPRPRAGGQ